MKLPHIQFAIIALIICNVVRCRERCNTKNVNLYVFDDVTRSRDLKNASNVNYNQLKTRPAIVIVTRQDVPHLCKGFMKKFTRTELLFLTNNRIRTIEPKAFGNAKKLKTLDLSNNKLKSIGAGLFNDLDQLVYLELSRNEIATIETASFDNMRNLKELNVSDNKLTTINNRWFNNCPNLQRLEFRKNAIIQLSYLTFLNLNGNLNVTIDLSMNKIRKIASGAFENLMHIERLELQKNDLIELPPFNGLRRGRLLNLKGNRIRCLKNKTLATLKRFEKVRMRSNEIEPNCTQIGDAVNRSKYHITFEH